MFDRICILVHNQIMKQAKFFRCLSDETRLRTLLLFEDEPDLCVCELAYALDMAQPKISRHLAAMRDAGLVTSCRRAQWVFYSLNIDMESWQKDIVVAAINGNKSEDIAKSDRSRLTNMKDRPSRCDELKGKLDKLSETGIKI